MVQWTLSPAGGGVCTTGLPTPCGTIRPGTTNGNSTTYTAPDVTGLPDPYYVNITATAEVNNAVQQTVTQEITQNAQAAIYINPSTLSIQAGSSDQVTFYATAINIPDFNADNVNWTMSGDSLAPSGETCGKSLGQYEDKGGAGCFAYPGDGGFRVCDNGSFDVPGGDDLTYS